MNQDELPEFPRLDADTRVRLTREWSAMAWAGTTDRLLAVQRDAEAALARAYADEVGALPAGEQQVYRARALGDSLRLRVRATGANGRLTRTGELSAVFAETDLSEIETVKIWNDGSATLPSMEVLLRRNPNFGSPVQVSVSGPDRQWVGGLADLLSAELRKSVPWWAFLRRGATAVGLGALLGWGVAGVLLATVTDDPRGQLGFAAFMSTLAGGFFGALVNRAVLHTVFPGFEVLEPGSTSRGRKVLGGLVTLLSVVLAVAGVVLGVLAL